MRFVQLILQLACQEKTQLEKKADKLQATVLTRYLVNKIGRYAKDADRDTSSPPIDW